MNNLLVILLFLAFCQFSLLAQDVNYEALAKRITTDNVQIKPGDVVVIMGGKHSIPIMEAIAIEAQKRGGLVTMFLYTDKLAYSLYHDVPNEYLAQEPKFFMEWVKEIDVLIQVPAYENMEAIIKDVPEEKFAIASKASQALDDAINSYKIRVLSIDEPSKADAALRELDFDTYAKMKWAAVNADYNKIAEDARKLEKILANGKTVKITTPYGTNLTFTLDKRPAFIDDGVIDEKDAASALTLQRVVSLPSGNIFVTAMENSANGKIVVPKLTMRNAETVTNVSCEFKNGKMTILNNDRYKTAMEEAMQQYTGPKDMFAGFQVGLNPAFKVMEDPGNYRPVSAAGMVYLSLGDNTMYGGKNKIEGGFFDDFPIKNATVVIDGKTIVKDGKLMLE